MTWDINTDSINLERDPQIKEWLNKAKLKSDWFDSTGDNEILTPYGEIISLDFDENGEYEGEASWKFISTSDPDEYGISYECYGRGAHKSYSYPEEVHYDEENLYGTFKNNAFNPLTFIGKIIEKWPLIAARVYTLCPDEWKKAIIDDFKSKNISTDILKGGSALNRFGL